MRNNSVKIGLIIIIMASFLLLNAQRFDVNKFSDPQKYGWIDHEKQLEAREDKLQRQKLLQIYEMNRFSYRDRLLKSALVPGWTHFAAGKYAKGQVILGLEVALFFSSFYYYDQAMNYYDKYKQSDYIGEIEDYYEKTKAPWRNCQIFFGLGVMVWVYNLYDTILTVDEYNTDLWQKIYLNYHNKKLSITEKGITYRF